MLENTSNQTARDIVRLRDKAAYRRERALYLAEGFRMVSELSREDIKLLILSESFSDIDQLAFLERQLELPLRSLRDGFQDGHKDGIHVIFAKENVMKKLSDTVSPQGILAVCYRRTYTLPQLTEADSPLLLVLEGIQDPGNMGTMLRTAEGAGISGILILKGCVDPFSPKAARSAAGSLCRSRLCFSDTPKEMLSELQKAGIRLFATKMDAKAFYDEEDYVKPTAFLIGNEANGLSEETVSCADRAIKIPMAGGLSSLNASMAAGILMYEANRQRRAGRI